MITVGFTCLAIGGQPLINYLSGESLKTPVPSIGVCVAGVILVCVGVLYKPKSENKLFSQLSRWSVSPIPYAILLFCLWIYFETLAIQRVNELAGLRNDVQSIAKVVDRLVLPRHLTKSQKTQISRFLSQFPPCVYAFKLSNRNEEAGQYREDIEDALMKGGWTRATKDPYVYTGDVQPGLTISFIQTMEHAQKPSDPKNPNPDVLLQEALGLAGVRIYGTGSGSGLGITQDSLVISVGPARKDSFELSPESFQ